MQNKEEKQGIVPVASEDSLPLASKRKGIVVATLGALSSAVCWYPRVLGNRLRRYPVVESPKVNVDNLHGSWLAIVLEVISYQWAKIVYQLDISQRGCLVSLQTLILFLLPFGLITWGLRWLITLSATASSFLRSILWVLFLAFVVFACACLFYAIIRFIWPVLKRLSTFAEHQVVSGLDEAESVSRMGDDEKTED